MNMYIYTSYKISKGYSKLNKIFHAKQNCYKEVDKMIYFFKCNFCLFYTERFGIIPLYLNPRDF